MKIRQQKTFNKSHIAFGEHLLDYSIADGSGSRSHLVTYTGTIRDRISDAERLRGFAE